MTAPDVRAQRFTATKWREGYHAADVDALLVRAATALEELAAGRPSPTLLTSDDVRSSRFEPTKLRPGYDQDEVDDFLDALADALDGARAARGTTQEPERRRTLLEADAEQRAAKRAGALDGAQLRDIRLTRTRLGEGYATADVDAFVERAAIALDEHRRGRTPSLRPQDVELVRFRSVRFREGYDQGEVDALLGQVAQALRR